MKLRDLLEAEGGEAAVDVGEALADLERQGVTPDMVQHYEEFCMKMIKLGADAVVLDGEIEFALPFFNATVVLDRKRSGFGIVHLTDVEDFVYDLHPGQNSDINSMDIAKVAKIDWNHFYAGLSTVSQLRNFMKKSFKP